MNLQNRIKQKINFNNPLQVKNAIGTLYFYFKRFKKDQKLILSTSEWIQKNVSQNVSFEWKNVLKYIDNIINLMRKNLQ